MKPVFNPDTYLNQPFEVSLETLSLCNAACNFCTYPELERIGTEMPNEKISELIREMATFEHPFYFSPFKVNEPFLDKRLITICKMMNSSVPHARLRLFTNGTPLIYELIEKINDLKNVEHLWVSLNSVDEVEYRSVMKLPLANTIKKLDLLHHAKQYKNFKHPVIVSRVASLDRMDNTTFITFCEARWPLFTPVLIKRDGWLGDVQAPLAQIPNTPCSRWFELSICATGVASLCCMDGNGKFAIGTVHTSSLLSIYNDPSFKERRKKLLSRKAVWPCNTCSY